MDYAERGAVEKTFDVLLADESGGFENLEDDKKIEFVNESNGLSSSGRLYAEGILTGMLATMRTFQEEPPDFTPEDAEEINHIITRREAELARRFNRS